MTTTIEQFMAERAHYAAMPCQGVTTFTIFPKDGNGIGREVPCGYVFNEHGDAVRCVPCELRRQDAAAASAATVVSAAPQSSVTLTQGAKKETRVEVKVYAADVTEAARLAREQYDALVAAYAAPTVEPTAPPTVESFCAEGPAACGYHQYLGARRPGETSDMSHEGYHAAVKATEQHAAGCKKWDGEQVCPICLDNETRLRA